MVYEILFIIGLFLVQYLCLYVLFKEKFYTKMESFNIKEELTTPYAMLVGAFGFYLFSKYYDFLIIGTVSLLMVLIFYKIIFQKDLKIFTVSFVTLLLSFVTWIIMQDIIVTAYADGVSMEGTYKDKEKHYNNILAYGIRNKSTEKYIVSYALPQRGDAISFNVNKGTDNYILNFTAKTLEEKYKGKNYIQFFKRVCAVGGDKCFMKNDRFYLHPHEGNDFVKEHYKGYVTVMIKNELYIKDPYLKDFPKIQFITDDPDYIALKELNTTQFDSYIKTIPKDHYFVMGDNRNVSLDSRLFGSIPFDWIIGKEISGYYNF